MQKSYILLFFVFLQGIGFSQFQQELSPSERRQQTIVTEPVTLYEGLFRGGIATEYTFTDKIFKDSGKGLPPGNIWGSSFSFCLFGQYGISDRLMVELFVPYVKGVAFQSAIYELPLDNSEQYLYPYQWRTEANGFGDVKVSAGYQMIEETTTRPALAAFLTATLPTGEKNVVDNNDNNSNTYSRPTGQGNYAFRSILRLRKTKYPFSYNLSAAYQYRTTAVKVVAVNEPAVRYHNGNLFDLSGSFNFQLNDWLAFKSITDMFQLGQDELNGKLVGEKAWLLQYLAGFSFQLKRVRFDQAVIIPLKGNNSPADPRFVVTMQYAL
jgi:hypothetical protein